MGGSGGWASDGQILTPVPEGLAMLQVITPLTLAAQVRIAPFRLLPCYPGYGDCSQPQPHAGYGAAQLAALFQHRVRIAF